MYLSKKHDGTIKGRMVYNGKPTREWLNKEDSSSPTVGLDSLFLTMVIDAKENRDIMTVDIPNAFIQTPLPELEVDEHVIMKISGVLVEILVKDSPDVYGPYVVYEGQKNTLYVTVRKAIYGMLISALLFYLKFRDDLEDIRFIFNPYDLCVGNRIVQGKQQSV